MPEEQLASRREGDDEVVGSAGPSEVAAGPDFGQELRRLRLAKGMSLGRLAAKVHYSKGQLSKIENGIARPGLQLAYSCDTALETGGVLATMLAAGAPAGPLRRRGRSLLVSVGLPPVPDLVGREIELDQLLTFLFQRLDPQAAGVCRVCVVHGMPGVGKTALVVRAAYLAAAAYPDGCLFLDMHGHTCETAPVTAADALNRCLRLLDVPGELIPQHVEDRSAMLRDRLRGRQILLVFDDVAISAQVQQLLPSDGTCAVLITSRRRMTALDDATHVELAPLTAPAAAVLFRSVAGRELAGSEAGMLIGQIAQRCGNLPLALRIAAARLRHDPELALAELAELLIQDRTYLVELDDGERTAAGVFSASFDYLTERDRQVLTSIARHPGPDLGLLSAAAMLDTDLADARRCLDRLVIVHLLNRQPGGRYRLHDLVRAYATQLARATAEPAEGSESMRRLLNHFLCLASAVDALIAPHRYRPAITPDTAGFALPGPRSRDEAVRWMSVEMDNLVAAVRAAADASMHRLTWQLAYALRGYFFLVKDWDRWIETHHLGLVAARQDGAADGEGYLLNGLGLAHYERGEMNAAADAYEQALAVFTALGDDLGTSSTLRNYAWVHNHRGDHLAALLAQQSALSHYEQLGARHNIAITLQGIAVAETGLGNCAAAVAHLKTARSIFVDLHLPLNEAMAVNCLGDAYRMAGDAEAAGTAYAQAAELAQACGSHYEQARAHHGLATVSPDAETAQQHLNTALRLYGPLAAPEVDQIRTMFRGQATLD